VSKLFTSLLVHAQTSREQLGVSSGIAEGRVSALLNGKKAWYLEDVERFAQALQLDPWRVLVFAEHATEATRNDFYRLSLNPGMRELVDEVEKAEASISRLADHRLSVSPPADDEPLPVAAHDKPKRKPRKGIEAEHDGA
jgi:hypothetical protein